MLNKLSLVMLVPLIVLAFASCSTSTTVTKSVTVTANSTVTATRTATVTAITVAPTPTATGTPTTNAADMANYGSSLYEANCAFTYCHANFGPMGANNGPASGAPAEVNFSKNALTYFGTAADLFVFMKSFMHHPDTASFMTDDQYAQVVAFLLLENGTLTATQPFGLSNLKTINLP